jgi:glutathione S-transferase-like protein
MAVKLHRCGNLWVKVNGHPCWRVQQALDELGIEYEVVPGPWPGRKKRTAVIAGTGQPLYPDIEFENGTWYREESADMARTIREGRLMEKSG